VNMFFLLVLLGQVTSNPSTSLAGTSAHVGTTTTVRVANTIPVTIVHPLGEVVSYVYSDDDSRLGATCKLQFGGVVSVIREENERVFTRYDRTPKLGEPGMCPPGVNFYVERDVFLLMEVGYRLGLAENEFVRHPSVENLARLNAALKMVNPNRVKTDGVIALHGPPR